MSVVAATLTGLALGLRHSVEADHVAAVATLVDERTERAGLVGTAWAVGHSLPIAALGAAALALGIGLPSWIVDRFEFLAGVLLVVLGLRLLARVVGLRRHRHGRADDAHAHLHLGPWSIGLTHAHQGGGSFLVGIVHGLAGSGALVALVATATPSTAASVAFLVAFAAASVLAMGAVAALWGRLLRTRGTGVLEALAGAVSVAMGLLFLFGDRFAWIHALEHALGHEHDHAGQARAALAEPATLLFERVAAAVPATVEWAVLTPIPV